jgi:hypothetical protein
MSEPHWQRVLQPLSGLQITAALVDNLTAIAGEILNQNDLAKPFLNPHPNKYRQQMITVILWHKLLGSFFM